MQINYSYYMLLTAKRPLGVLTLPEVHKLITSGDLKQQTDLVREILRSGDAARAQSLKRQLPCITPHARFEGARRSAEALDHTGTLFIDFDHCRQPLSELLDVCREIPYVLLAQRSVSGDGLHLLVRVDATLENHDRIYSAVGRELSDFLNESYDSSCRDLARVKLLSYDPDAYLNENAEAFPFVEPSLPEVKEAVGGNLSAYLDKCRFSLAAGSRHNRLVSLAANLNRAGFPEQEVIRECCSRYAMSDFPESEIVRIITDLYAKYASEFGVNRRSYGDGLETKGTKGHLSLSKNYDVPEYDPSFLDNEEIIRELPSFPSAVYEQLPPLLSRIVSQTSSSSLRDVELLASLAILGSTMPTVSGILREESFTPNLFLGIIGESGSGKGNIMRLHRLVESYQKSIYEKSKREVQRYQQELALYEEERLERKKQKAKSSAAEAKAFRLAPEPVYQRNLLLSGYVSAARMGEMLKVNAPYSSLMFETELEAVTHINGTEFGGYMDLLNKSFHHETVSQNTITRGTVTVTRPRLSVVLSGTPEMLSDFIPGTENGTFSRFLFYRLSPADHFIPLSANDDIPDISDYYYRLGDKVLEFANFLYDHPTKVRFTNRQRAVLNAYCSKEYEKNEVARLRGFNSVLQRALISMFRICMILTALRKAEAGWDLAVMDVDDADFETAFAIMKVCLQHSYTIAGGLKGSSYREKPLQRPDTMYRLFLEMPEVYRRSDFVARAEKQGLYAKAVDRLHKKAIQKGWLIPLSRGLYQKSEKGLRLQ